MDSRYSVYVHGDLIEVLSKRSSPARKVMNFIRSLAEDPFQTGDFTDHDASLRPRQIKIIGDYAITYWADHAVKSVMVVDIGTADK